MGAVETTTMASRKHPYLAVHIEMLVQKYDQIKQVTYIKGKEKFAPNKAVTIPGLELCAAVIGIEISQIIQDQLDINPKYIH